MTDAPLPDWLDRRLSPRQRDLALRARPWLMPGGFVAGFCIDAATLRRVDDVGDNVQLTAFLLAAALLLIFERRAWHGRATLGLVSAHRGLARLGLQVLFGGLFSAYFIFYSRSATLGPSLFFLCLLGALMLANELWFEDLRPDLPQVGLWFFSALSYLLFAVPTWTGHLGPGTRVVAAVLAVVATLLLVLAIHWGPVRDPTAPAGWSADADTLRPALRRTGLLCAAMLGALWILVKLGAVPPVPLALAEAGIFHSIERSDQGYVAAYERPPWWTPWRRDDRPFRLHPGDRVHAFTAVFAPSDTQVRILHTWEHYDGDDWVETDRIPWTMKGGRDGGWRSWTAKRNVVPGEWRVRVLSEHGDELGRIQFLVLDAGTDPPAELRTRTY